VSSGQVSPLRVLSLLKQHGAGVRRSELERELQASPAAVETAVLRLVKEGLVTVQRGGGPDELLIAP
jgi:Mn-dependent DtxR family transcriptional regulator